TSPSSDITSRMSMERTSAMPRSSLPVLRQVISSLPISGWTRSARRPGAGRVSRARGPRPWVHPGPFARDGPQFRTRKPTPIGVFLRRGLFSPGKHTRRRAITPLAWRVRPRKSVQEALSAAPLSRHHQLVAGVFAFEVGGVLGRELAEAFEEEREVVGEVGGLRAGAVACLDACLTTCGGRPPARFGGWGCPTGTVAKPAAGRRSAC